MKSLSAFSILTVSALALGLTVAFAQNSKPPNASGEKFYRAQVEPILKASCFVCHSEDGSGGLNLRTRAGLLKGGVSGAAIDLKKPLESLFVHAIKYEGRNMPPSGKLLQAQIDVLVKWVKIGAPMPATKGDAEPVKHGPPQVNAENKRFWSFQPVKRPKVPTVKNTTWSKNPIDAFILAKLEKNKLTPALPASKTALLRRAYYDLIGLPPKPEEVTAFLADKSPNAYAKVVDRLLASPQYGEKWGRHWLDLVRYAETNSFERDNPKPFVWRYRDYVVNAFNSDKPYDRFLREQLAGDELPNSTPETIIATGYYRLGAWDDEPSDPLQARYDEIDDIVATTSQTMLGLTVNCARCHDHKIDPIPQKDYYRMVACFQGVNRYGERSYESIEAQSLRPIVPEAEIRRFMDEDKAHRAKLKAVNTERGEIEKIVKADFMPVEHEEFRDEQKRVSLVQKRVGTKITKEQFDQYVALMEQHRVLMASPPKGLEKALAVTEAGRKPQVTNLLVRGNPHSPGEEVMPGFPSVLSPPEPKIAELPANVNSSGRRIALADWITDPTNPLTARVMVNRIWQHHFGRGIVRSTSNFGFLGSKPTHPELLDYLASEFVKGGWRMKPFHRQIMLSQTYKMASTASKVGLTKDPENDFFWRFDMRRLSAEEVRDSILAANNTLDLKLGGASIYTTMPAEVLAGQSVPGANWFTSPRDQQNRRSLYIHIKRSMSVPILASFDAADTDSTCPVRFTTTQPTQALGMINSTFLNEQAQFFADYLTKNAKTTPAQVTLALKRVAQREPKATEIQRGMAFIASAKTKHKLTEAQALKQYCLIALNLNEFIYLD